MTLPCLSYFIVHGYKLPWGPGLGSLPHSFESCQVEPWPWMLFRPAWLKPCNTDFALKLSSTCLLCGKCSNLFQIKWQGAFNSDNLIPISSAGLKYDPLTLDFTWVNKLTSSLQQCYFGKENLSVPLFLMLTHTT